MASSGSVAKNQFLRFKYSLRLGFEQRNFWAAFFVFLVHSLQPIRYPSHTGIREKRFEV